MTKTLTYESDQDTATATYRRDETTLWLATRKIIPRGDLYVRHFTFSAMFKLPGDDEERCLVRLTVDPADPLGEQLQKVHDGDTIISALENILSLIKNGWV